MVDGLHREQINPDLECCPRPYLGLNADATTKDKQAESLKNLDTKTPVDEENQLDNAVDGIE